MKTVSVVIPNYNYAKTLALCLDSVYAQSHPPAEVIVVDDGSTDGSRDVIRRYPCTLLESPGNQGVSAARNRGVAASSGEVLFFLDSDEALAPDALANAVELLAADPGLGCVHGILADTPLVDDGPVEAYKVLHSHFWRARGVGETATAFFAQAAVPRAVFDAVGPFDERLRDSEDLEYSERLAARYRILLTDRIVAFHDDEDRLGPLLREQFRRSQQLVPTVLAARRQRSAGLRANKPLGVLAVGLALVTLPLVGTALWWVPLLLVGLFVLADVGLARFVAHRRGALFLAYFLVLHLLTHVALVAGAVVGAVRWAAPKPGRVPVRT
ncbi:glycosyltransferase family 2 protein [Longispora urticae]